MLLCSRVTSSMRTCLVWVLVAAVMVQAEELHQHHRMTANQQGRERAGATNGQPLTRPVTAHRLGQRHQESTNNHWLDMLPQLQPFSKSSPLIYATPAPQDNSHSDAGRLTVSPASVQTDARQAMTKNNEHRRQRNQRRRSEGRRSNGRFAGRPPLCCGSNVPLHQHNALATGNFSRTASGGSIKVVEVAPSHVDLMGPAIVRDLSATPTSPRSLTLQWTAPGDDLDSGTAAWYVIRMSERVEDLVEKNFNAAPDSTQLRVDALLEAAGVYQEAGTQVMVQVPLVTDLLPGHHYYVALRSYDDQQNASPVSNLARFYVPPAHIDSPVTRGHRHFQQRPSQRSFPYTNTRRAPHHPSNPSQNPPAPDMSGDAMMRNVLPQGSLLQPAPSPRPETSVERYRQQPQPRLISPHQPLTTTPLPATTTQPLTTTSPPATHSPETTHEGMQNSGNDQESGQRHNKRNKKKRNKKRGKKSGRKNRQDNSRTTSSTPTYYVEGQCEPRTDQQALNISLCHATFSLHLVIKYLEHNNELQHLDYLWATLHTLKQKTAPPWHQQPANHTRHT